MAPRRVRSVVALFFLLAVTREVEAKEKAEEEGSDGNHNPFGAISHGYNKGEPPGQAFPVYLGLHLNKLHGVDATTGTIRTSAWIRLYWYDWRLSLNATLASSVALDADSIWKPDVEIMELVDEFQENCNDHAVRLYNSNFTRDMTIGRRYNVFYSRACVLTTKCPIQLNEFPFDDNHCNMTFAPWSDTSYVLIPADDVTKADFHTQQYKVELGALPLVTEMQYQALPGKMPLLESAVVVQLHLFRYSRYYVVNYILPIVLMVALSQFTFYIPVKGVDRIAYCVTLMLTGMAVQFITSDKRPAEKVDGWIDVFQTSAFLLIVIPILESVLLMRMLAMYERRGDDAAAEGLRLAQAVDRFVRAFAPIALLVWVVIEFGPHSPIWRTRHWQHAGESVCVKLFLAFWIPLGIALFVLSCVNWCRFGPHRPSLRHCIEVMWDDHDKAPEEESDSDLLESARENRSDRETHNEYAKGRKGDVVGSRALLLTHASAEA